MEQLHGEDLQHLVGRVGPLPPGVALRIAAQALAGLAKAHEVGIVHRDVQAGVLFLAQRDDGEITVKVLDFGIAKVTPDALRVASTSGLTETGGLLGSPLSPPSSEQMRCSTERQRAHRPLVARGLNAPLPRPHQARPLRPVGNVLELVLAVRGSEGPGRSGGSPPWVSRRGGRENWCAARSPSIPEQRWPTAAAMLAAIRDLLPGGVALREDMLAGVSPETRASATAPTAGEEADALPRASPRPPLRRPRALIAAAIAVSSPREAARRPAPPAARRDHPPRRRRSRPSPTVPVASPSPPPSLRPSCAAA